ncbi:MAG: ATP-binding protein, partial [Anaerovorax sp.]
SKKISVTLTQKKGITRCEITDSGQGIEESELAHIWDRYYKASSNHSRTTTGTGLGLSIVKEILILHNAQFGVESQVGCGSTFWFELPS